MNAQDSLANTVRTAQAKKSAGLVSGIRALGDADLGLLRVLIVLACIWTYFGVANPVFLSSVNLSNLALQIAAVGTVSIGVVLVLLLGEIDVSVGAVSGMCAAIVAVLSVKFGLPAWLAIPAGILAGGLVGLVQGTIVTWLVIPSFVVTLAGFLGWAGVKLAVLGNAGTLNITDPNIINLANSFIPDWLSWTLAGIFILAFFGRALIGRARRSQAGLESDGTLKTFARPSVAAVIAVLAVGVLTADRGVPLSLCILVALVAAFSWLITATRFGRHVLAVGGNQEAARRVGIPVRRIKVIVFFLGGAMAATGGILSIARLLSVDQSAGSGNFLLYAIAAPVIAGVSLFGGRGSVWAALLGAVVIGSIQNGMNLLAYPASIQAIVTALVLRFAVMLDAIARRRKAS